MIALIVILIVLGVVLQLLKARIDPTLYGLILVLIILAVCVLILQAFGIWGGGGLRLK